jgi:ABC-type phosphate transport system permease subunit
MRLFCTMSHCVMCCVPCVRRSSDGDDDETVTPHLDHSLSMVAVCASVKLPRAVLCGVYLTCFDMC